MPPLGFEPTISAGERPKTYALDRLPLWYGADIQLTSTLHLVSQRHYRSKYRDDNSYCGLLGSDNCSLDSVYRRFGRTYWLNPRCQKHFEMVTSYRTVRGVNMGQSCGPTEPRMGERTGNIARSTGTLNRMMPKNISWPLQSPSELIINLLKPNDIYIYICRTAALTSRRYILCIYSTNIHTEYFKHAA